ncbi:MAG: prepilin-type N-terminal cleavage/methylation domain-containing protein [Armatimonadetes bacterium]|nr:prepilin-type N-terminal cleavage/methylation domain-containing protein [Armatimonadota bacterium]
MRRRERGFTLIEVIVALTILAVSILLITRAFLILIQVTNQGGNKTVASALAVRVLEEIRSRPESQSSSAGWTANFDAIASQSLTNFGAPYGNYAFEVLVNQVDLSTPQPDWLSDYSHSNAVKWVTVRVDSRGRTLAQVSSAVVRDMYRRP